MRYQIAQKVHTRCLTPTTHRTSRTTAPEMSSTCSCCTSSARPGNPNPAPRVKAAILDIFDTRARDASTLGYPERTWPARITPYPHWTANFERAAQSAAVADTLKQAATQRTWLDELDAS